MEDLEFKEKDLEIETLGDAKIDSPLQLSTVYGDSIANFVNDSDTVLFYHDKEVILRRLKEGRPLLAFEKGGPRQKIFFDPSITKAGIVTCGGLCPGINNVIRSIVMTLFYRYNVKTIFGFKYGCQGFIPTYGHEPVSLTPDFVRDILEKGGSVLASSRGVQDIGEIVDCLERMNVSILFMIGGDGTLRCAQAIFEEIKRRKLKISVIGVPKTIDNDICFVEKTFGLETAFSIAAQAISSAYVEASGAPYGIGLVKVMGRLSGFIAANAALALNVVNFVLIPEVPFDLDGPKGFLAVLEKRLRLRKYAVIVVAEGAGQTFCTEGRDEKDESGNLRLGDIGIFLKDQIKRYFMEKTDLYVNIKYIDPSYLVRSVPANAHDAIYCMQLAQNSVHAGMAGKTGMIVGLWNSNFTHVPIKLAVSRRKQLSPEDPLWLSVLESTGQPIRMVNN
ncbi:MAG: diphosphate--fructose-6-phosphate 1-phosphotransferase [Spirochaetes bacterium DG_61]|nr:MAG: diphosphate--fructose-6-phosphate 1-phosphotransferase [Spirochaetes bacterium DG_61]